MQYAWGPLELLLQLIHEVMNLVEAAPSEFCWGERDADPPICVRQYGPSARVVSHQACEAMAEANISAAFVG